MQKNRDKIANLFQGRYNFVTFQRSNSFQKNIIQYDYRITLNSNQ